MNNATVGEITQRVSNSNPLHVSTSQPVLTVWGYGRVLRLRRHDPTPSGGDRIAVVGDRGD